MVYSDGVKEKIKGIQDNNERLSNRSLLPKKSQFRSDGYMNVLNKYGTPQDNSEAYFYQPEEQTDDVVLTSQYETNGLFAKIIDIPAQEAVKKGFNLNIADKNVEDLIQKKIRKLHFLERVEEALKWSRLYGGAIAIMIIDDGSPDLALPVNWKRAKNIEDIVVYEKAVVTPDYGSMYSGYGAYGEKRTSKFRMPEFYNVFSIYGAFRIHESRCLLFRNGRMPEKASNVEYRFWGIPEYNRIKRALRETITSHGNAAKLLDRSVQAVYKMQNLSEILATAEGEDQVIKRLQIIDMARGLLNSIAIDNNGEDYDFKSVTLTGVNEIIDASCNMLSALTEIPQTKLFGRSPAGMNATGESDMENYYNFVDKIREMQMRDNLYTLIDAIIATLVNKGEISEKPNYELEFEPLWNEKESDRATIEQTNAQTDLVKAQTAQMYIDMGVIDPAEVRKALKEEGKFGIEDEELPEQEESLEDIISQISNKDNRQDSVDSPYNGATGVGVLVIKDGKILVGNRDDTNELGGPGGHIEDWEDAEQAARRETAEECGIELENLIPLGFVENMPEQYGKPFTFLSTEFKGEPLTNTQELLNNRFLPLSDLQNGDLYAPFNGSIKLLIRKLSEDLTQEGQLDKMDDEWNESDHPRDKDGKFTSGGNQSGGSSQSGSEDKPKDTEQPKKSSRKLAVPEGQALRDRILADTGGDLSVEDIIADPVMQKAAASHRGDTLRSTHKKSDEARIQLRQSIADDIASRGSISGYNGNGDPIYSGPVKKGFRAEIVIGPPAAGKSSVIVDRVSTNTQSRVIDSDEVKKQLPEFDGGNGAGIVHKESSAILEDMIMPQFGVGGPHNGENLVIPIVGKDQEKVERYLQSLKDAGYEVHLSFNDVSPETSLRRAVLRYIQEGRYIDPSYILQVGDNPRKTYEALKAKGGFASYSRYNNEVERGKPATKVERLNASGTPIDWEDWQ